MLNQRLGKLIFEPPLTLESGYKRKNQLFVAILLLVMMAESENECMSLFVLSLARV